MERQQGRIRGLIEEQCAKVEEERARMERRWRDQVEALRIYLRLRIKIKD